MGLVLCWSLRDHVFCVEQLIVMRERMAPFKELRNWLQIRPNQGHVETNWAVLDNGIISVYRKPNDSFPKFVFPLHSAIVNANEIKDRLIIHCKATNCRLELSTTAAQLLDWLSCIKAAVKEWRNKKRTSILYKNRLRFDIIKDTSILNKEEDHVTSNVAASMMSLSLPINEGNYQRLHDISMLPEEERLSWTELPEVAVTKCAELLSQQQLEANDLTFGLVISEIVYNQELGRLVELARSSIHWKDSLPLFNRRSIVGCAVRTKKCSNNLVKRLSHEWAKANSLSTDLHRLYNILESYYDTSTAQTLVAYCDVLDDARSMIRRATQNDSTLMTHAFSARCHIEYTLLPVRHLNQTYRTLQKILRLLRSDENNQHYLQCQQLIVTITGILDYCFKVLSTHHGSNYLADIDNLLDFSSKLSTLKLKRRSLQSSIRNHKESNISKTNELIPATDNIINTKIDLNESFNLIDLRSVENLLIDSKVDATSSSSESEAFPFRNSSNASTSDEGCYEMIELKNYEQPKSSSSDDSSIHAEGRSKARDCLEVERQKETRNSTDEQTSSSKWYCDDNVLNTKHVLQKSFEDEPLYQVYTERSHESAMGAEEKSTKPRTNSVFYTYLDLPENIYEEIGGKDGRREEKRTIGLRTLWCETDEVVASEVLNKLSSFQKALQESKFEILTSEVSYLKSINVLITLFVESLELAAVLNPEERRALYSNILEVRRASEIFLFDLAGHWEEDFMLSSICSVVHRHALASFRVYIDYCSNQIRFHKTLQHLLLYNKQFEDMVLRIESSPECHGYSLQSFLTLPMQRVTRLPLLLQAIQRRLTIGTPEYTSCKVTLSALNQLVHDCNEGVRNNEQSEQLLALNNILNEVGPTEEKTETSEENVEKPRKKLSLTRTWKLFSLQES